VLTHGGSGAGKMVMKNISSNRKKRLMKMTKRQSGEEERKKKIEMSNPAKSGINQREKSEKIWRNISRRNSKTTAASIMKAASWLKHRNKAP